MTASTNSNASSNRLSDNAAANKKPSDEATATAAGHQIFLQTFSTTPDDEPRALRRSRRRGGFFRSILCCFSSSISRSKSTTTATESQKSMSAAAGSKYAFASLVSTSTTSSPIFSVASSSSDDSPSSPHSTSVDTMDTTTDSRQNLIASVCPGQIRLLPQACDLVKRQQPYEYSAKNVILYESSSTDESEDKNNLLPPVRPSDIGKKCLIIDLDETLVHSSFKQVNNADFIVPVEIDGVTHQVYVLKRPYVDEFLKRMGELFECVLFTASLAKYADPVADLLDKSGVFRARLFREACVYYRGNYIKDLSRLGRDVNKVIILDNSPASYIFHPENAVPCTSWFEDMRDRELLDLIPHFERLAAADNIYPLLKNADAQQPSLLLPSPPPPPPSASSSVSSHLGGHMQASVAVSS